MKDIIQPDISIIVVNYKVADDIVKLIHSVKQAEMADKSEIILVDNASNDNSEKKITSLFNDVSWISLKNNIGFGKACNAASIKAKGKYLLFINPDTLISENSLKDSFDFMEENPDVGLMGPKIIGSDGEFQRACRRSFPTPINAFLYFTGLSKLFPKNPTFGKYNLSHLDPDEASDVDAISGSFMFMQRKLFKKIGGFDKAFFMFGEDLDLAVRVKEEGYRVYYNPKVQIFHFKGKSCARNMIRSRLAFYEAMLIFSKKHSKSYGAYFPNWLIALGIGLISILNIAGILFKLITPALIDLFFINTTLFTVITVRYKYLSYPTPYMAVNIPITLLMHFLISIIYIAVNLHQGIYQSEKYSLRRILFSGQLSSILFFTGVYFVKSMGFSRLSFGLSTILIPLFLAGWRKAIPNTLTHFKNKMFYTGNVILVGYCNITSKLINSIESDKTANITGIICPDSKNIPASFDGYPILGTLNDMNKIFAKQKIDLLIFATDISWYSALINSISLINLKKTVIKWVPAELFYVDKKDIPEEIPLNNFSI